MKHKKSFNILFIAVVSVGIVFGFKYQVLAKTDSIASMDEASKIEAAFAKPIISKETAAKLEEITASIVKETAGAPVQEDPIILNADKFKNIISDGVGVNIAATIMPAALLTIFADPSTGSDGNSSWQLAATIYGKHSFITVKNTTSSNITVGKFSNVAPGKTVSLGTWYYKASGASEHTGLWYNLEEYKISRSDPYLNRVSLSFYLTAAQLARLNSYIISHDSWGPLLTAGYNNCATFSTGAWNAAVDPSYYLNSRLPSGANSNIVLAASIKSKGNYSVRLAVPYNYPVYYANGSGLLTRSLINR